MVESLSDLQYRICGKRYPNRAGLISELSVEGKGCDEIFLGPASSHSEPPADAVRSLDREALKLAFDRLAHPLIERASKISKPFKKKEKQEIESAIPREIPLSVSPHLPNPPKHQLYLQDR
jgi:hypothetical protein